MAISVKIKVKHNFKKFDKISSQMARTVAESIEDILKNIQGYAIRLERGHNEQGIICEMVNMSTKEVKGRVFAKPDKFMTDAGQSYLWFEYFGTGSQAEMTHVGKTKHFIESGYSEWYIPVNKVGRSLNYPIITIGNNQFYVARGSKANHFMSDGEFQSRNENMDIVKKKIQEMLKEACK